MAEQFVRLPISLLTAVILTGIGDGEYIDLPATINGAPIDVRVYLTSEDDDCE